MTDSVNDLAICIDYLTPAAEYSGSTNSNTKTQYELLIWNDSRVKPTWEQIVDAELNLTKSNQKEIIKQSYEQCLLEGCGCFLGFKVDCKPSDISNWTSMLVLIDTAKMTDDQYISLRDFDNITHYVTVGYFKAMTIQVGLYYQALFGAKWHYQQQIDNAQTKEEVISINWITPPVPSIT
jgi:hypothetical protein